MALTTTRFLFTFLTLSTAVANALPAFQVTNANNPTRKTRRDDCNARISSTGWYAEGGEKGLRIFSSGTNTDQCDGIQEITSDGPVTSGHNFSLARCLNIGDIDHTKAFAVTSTERDKKLHDLRMFYWSYPAEDGGAYIRQATWNGTEWPTYSDPSITNINHYVEGADTNLLAAISYVYKGKSIWSVLYIEHNWLKEMTRDEDGNTIEWKMYGNGFDLGKQSSDGDNESKYMVDSPTDLQAMSFVNQQNVAIKGVYVLDSTHTLREFTWRSNNPHADLQPSGFVLSNVQSFSVSHVYYNGVEPHARLYVQLTGTEGRIKEFWNNGKIYRDAIQWADNLDVPSLDVNVASKNSKFVSHPDVKLLSRSSITSAFQLYPKGQGYMSVFYTDDRCNIMTSYRDPEGVWTLGNTQIIQ